MNITMNVGINIYVYDCQCINVKQSKITNLLLASFLLYVCSQSLADLLVMTS